MTQVSEAKLAANRENAKKSTGPRTQEGKERSRQNALKHGMTAGVVVAEEMRGMAEERIKAWTGALKPQTEPEAWLVERAAVDAVRADAATRCERARLEARLRNDAVYTRDEGIAEVGADRLGRQFFGAEDEDTPGLLLRLRGTRAGCEWLLKRWRDLARRQMAQGPWGSYEFHQARRLAGGEYLGDVGHGDVMSEGLARLCVDYMLSSYGGIYKDQATAGHVRRACWDLDAMAAADGEPNSPASIYAANRRLGEFIVEHILELEDRIEAFREAEALDASLAAERLLVDLSADGKLLHRYETELVRRVQHALDQLGRIRKSTPQHETTSSPSARPEPPRAESAVKTPQPFRKHSRNEPRPPVAASSSLRPIRVPTPPPRPARSPRPAALAISVTPLTPPSSILTALSETPEGRLRALRDKHLSELQRTTPPELVTALLKGDFDVTDAGLRFPQKPDRRPESRPV